jgi:hypothetical protein
MVMPPGSGFGWIKARRCAIRHAQCEAQTASPVAFRKTANIRSGSEAYENPQNDCFRFAEFYLTPTPNQWL